MLNCFLCKILRMVDLRTRCNKKFYNRNGQSKKSKDKNQNAGSNSKQKTFNELICSSNAVPKFKKRHIMILFLIIVILLCLLIAYVSGAFESIEDAPRLIPPNPEVMLPASPSRLHMFEKGAVCADGAPCAAIGRNILLQNGSAVDAAIATLFCNGIVNMQSMGLGGGFLMTIYIRSDKKAFTLNAREAAPLNATADMYKDKSKKAQRGPLAVAVPGELKGYWAAHKKFGKLPWKELVQPAIDLCRTGYNMSKAQWDSLNFNNDVKNDAVLREIFVDENGKFKKGGSLIKLSKYCDTLKIIAEKGGDELYKGDLAKVFVKDIQDMGGIITKEDMERYEAIWEDPIKTMLKGKDTLFSVPLPGSGALLSFILNVLQGYDFTKDSINGVNNTVLTYHRIIEAFKYAFARRTELGDSRFNNITELVHNLTSVDYANSIREMIKDDETFDDPGYYGAVRYNQNDNGTAHISILAPNGDAVSVTSTVNLYFGAGITSRSTGIILNSGMDDFSSSMFSNYFKLPPSPNNMIAPEKRSLSSMSPSIIVDENGDVRMVIGASGGTKIPTAIALVIINNLWFGKNVKQSVDGARFHHQLFPMEISYEYGILQQVISGLEALGHKTSRYRERGSIICALTRENGSIYANADFRKGGDVFGLN